MRNELTFFRFLGVALSFGWLLLGAGLPEARAQQDVMISQYLFNGLLINPGRAGSHPYTSSSLLHRSQWNQFDGAPTTSVVAVDGALRNNSMGMGVLMLHDQIGLTTQTDVSLNFAYRMRLGAGRLAFGLRGGLSNTRADLFAAETTDPGDPNYSENQQITQSGRFGFGMYYHLQRFYLGVSIPTLTVLGPLAQTVDPHLLATAGVVLQASDGVMLKPSVLVKAVNGAPPNRPQLPRPLPGENLGGCRMEDGGCHCRHDGNPGDPRVENRVCPRLHLERDSRLFFRLQRAPDRIRFRTGHHGQAFTPLLLRTSPCFDSPRCR